MAPDRAKALEKMLQRSPEDSRLRFGLALEYLRAGRSQDGVRELRAYLAASDDEGNAWGRLAAVLHQMVSCPSRLHLAVALWGSM